MARQDLIDPVCCPYMLYTKHEMKSSRRPGGLRARAKGYRPRSLVHLSSSVSHQTLLRYGSQSRARSDTFTRSRLPWSSEILAQCLRILV